MATGAALLTRALEMHRAGRLDDAAAIYAQLLADDPGHADAAHLLGLLYRRRNDLDAAIRLIRQAIVKVPENPLYHANLGHVLRDAGRSTDAMVSYRRALDLHPAYPEIHNSLGSVLQADGKLDEAIHHYRKAIELKPEHFRAHYNLGIALFLLGDGEAAIAAFHQAASYNPDFAPIWENLGIALERLGRHAEAESCFRRWTEVEPRSADAFDALAFALQARGRSGEALAACQRAIAIRPDFVAAHLHAAGLLERENRLPEALAHAQRATEIAPDDLPAAATALWQAQKLCDWSTIAARARYVLQGSLEHPEGATPFQLLSLPGASRGLLLKAARAHAVKIAPGQRFAHDRARFGDIARLRVGYLSADFHEHATAYLTAEVFEQHDRERFEVLLFSYGRDDGSAMRRRLEAGCDRFVDVAGLAHDAAARRIRDEGIQILVDLKGYTTDSRPQIAAYRPAPIQANWLGFPGSMGADWIDYLIADPCVIPPEHDTDYDEKVVRLPHCYQSNDRKRPIDHGGISRAACGLPEAEFVFCCFNQTYKIDPRLFEVWMRLLAALPESVLWLLEDNPWAKANLQQEALRRRVAPERLVFASRRPLAEHLGRYALADLALDTFPYTSHTTGSDSLWAGCPLLTMIGDTFASRVAASLLFSVGLGDLVVTSLAAYEALALTLARDRSRREDLRRRLRVARDAAPLFDSPRFTCSLEAAYGRMWARFAAGHGPQALEVQEDAGCRNAC